MHLSQPHWVYYTTGGYTYNPDTGESQTTLEIWRLNTNTGQSALMYQDGGYTTTDYMGSDGSPLIEYAVRANFYTNAAEGNQSLYIALTYSLPASCFPVYAYRGLQVLPDGGLSQIYMALEHRFNNDAMDATNLSASNGTVSSLAAIEEQAQEAESAPAQDGPLVSALADEGIGFLPYNECFRIGEDYYVMTWPYLQPALGKLDGPPNTATSYQPIFYADYESFYYMSGVYGCQVGPYLLMYCDMRGNPAVFVIDSRTEQLGYVTAQPTDIWVAA